MRANTITAVAACLAIAWCVHLTRRQGELAATVDWLFQDSGTQNDIATSILDHIDRLDADVDDLWGVTDTLDLDTDRVDHISVMNQKLENLRESTEALTRKDHTND